MNRNALISRAKFSWGAYVLLAVLVLVFLRLLFPNFFWTIFSPIFRNADNAASVSRAYIGGLQGMVTLSRENERLSNENARIFQENAALKQELANVEGFTLPADNGGIVAGVISHPPESPYDTFLINAGSKDGVEIGMEAFAPPRVPIGIVTSLLPNFSRVTLYSSPSMRLSGWVGESNLPLKIVGTGAGAFVANVPRTSEVKTGDLVNVSGPLPIGTVVRIDSDPSSPSVVLRIVPFANPFSINSVLLKDTGKALAPDFLISTST